MKQATLATLLSVLTAIPAYSVEKTDAENYQIFQKADGKAKRDLGPRCKYKTAAEAAAADAKITNPDSKLDYPAFLAKVQHNGLLDDKLFLEKGHFKDMAEAHGAAQWIVSETDKQNAGSAEKCFMNKKEIFALYYYTGAGYQMINPIIRENDTVPKGSPERAAVDKRLSDMRIIGEHLSWALDKIVPYVGYVKRVQALNKDSHKAIEFLTQFSKNKTVTMGAYTSTTIDYASFQGEVKEVLQTVKDSKCRYVADFSLVEATQGEEEVLCQPHTQFKVLMHRPDDGADAKYYENHPEMIYQTHEILLQEIK